MYEVALYYNQVFAPPPRPVPVSFLHRYKHSTQEKKFSHTEEKTLVRFPKMEGNFLITGAAQGFGKEFTRRVLKSKYVGFSSLQPSTIHLPA